MAIPVSTAVTRITANAASVATSMASGTTTAEATAVATVLNVLVKRPDLMAQVLKLANTNDLTPA